MSSPAVTCRRSTDSHVYQVWVYERLPAERPSKPANTTIVVRNDASTMIVATQPALGLPSLRPVAASTRNPTKGNSGIRKAACSTEPSAFQHVDVVGGGSDPAPVDGNDDTEADYQH